MFEITINVLGRRFIISIDKQKKLGLKSDRVVKMVNELNTPAQYAELMRVCERIGREV